MPIGSFLVALAGPLAWKVLSSLGIGILVYVGVEAMVDQVIGYAQSSWGQLPATVMQLMALAGVNSALSIIAGGVSARVSFMTLKRFGLK